MIRGGNLIYKLLALVVAFVLWGYVNSERNPHSRRTLVVPIEVRNLERGYTPTPGAGEAGITLSGLKATVDSVRKEDVSAWIDLRRVRAQGTVTAKVMARISGVSEGDLEIGIAPRQTRVEVEAVGVRRFPVEVKYLAAPPLGYSYSDPVITPASVRISGKSARVQQVKRAIIALPEQNSTNPIDDYFAVTPLDSRGNIVNGVELEPDRVQLKTEFVEVPATKAVLVSPSIFGEPRFPARVTRVAVQPSSVTLEGKPSSLVGVSTVTTERISIDDETATVAKDVSLRLPPDVDVVGRSTVRVTVYIAAPQ